jgi:protein gp37
MKPAPDRMAKGMWWDRAWSLVSGCTPVSDGCDRCWAARESHMRANHPNAKIAASNKWLTRLDYPDPRGNPNIVYNGTARENWDLLDLPTKTRKPTVWAIWNDLFHPAVTWDFIFEVYKRMVFCPQHTFLILTKRPERINIVIADIGFHLQRNFHDRSWPLPNVIHGTTIENDRHYHRIAHLLRVPGYHHMLSVEPMLGPLIIDHWLGDNYSSIHGGFDNGIDLVICGGETGPGARPMDPEWARSLRDQCVAAGVAFWLKNVDGKHGRLLDGRTWNEWPGDET